MSAKDCNGQACATCTEAENAGLTIENADVVPSAMRALNTMRKNRQFFDLLLRFYNVEVPAHCAVLAAVSPYILELFTNFQVSGAKLMPHPFTITVNKECDKEALFALIDYAYTGILNVEPHKVRAVHACAYQLRMDSVVRVCAEHFTSRLCVDTCLDTRSLPGLPKSARGIVDAYISTNFSQMYSGNLLSGLPAIKVEVVSGVRLGESGVQLARMALDWLRSSDSPCNMEALTSQTHLLYMCDGELKDCTNIPQTDDESPILQDYRNQPPHRNRPDAKPYSKNNFGFSIVELEERVQPELDWSVVACDQVGEQIYVALVSIAGRLALVSLAVRSWLRRECSAQTRPPATLLRRRAAHGAVATDSHLIVCGGYDRAHCLSSVERYDHCSNEWSPLPDMLTRRARFNIAKVGNKIFAVGGCNGSQELKSVEMLDYHDDMGDRDTPTEGKRAWQWRASLPTPLVQMAVIADEANGTIYCLGGGSGDISLKETYVYNIHTDTWSQGPPLLKSRSQLAGCIWQDRVWAIGGVHTCEVLNTTETLPLKNGTVWQPGPSLLEERRSSFACSWRGRLCVAGGSDGACALRTFELLDVDSPSVRGPSLRQARTGLTLSVLDDTLYAVGGFSGKEFLSSMEYLTDLNGEWTTVYPPQDLSNMTSSTHEDRQKQSNGRHTNTNGSRKQANSDSEGELSSKKSSINGSHENIAVKRDVKHTNGTDKQSSLDDALIGDVIAESLEQLNV